MYLLLRHAITWMLCDCFVEIVHTHKVASTGRDSRVTWYECVSNLRKGEPWFMCMSALFFPVGKVEQVNKGNI